MDGAICCECMLHAETKLRYVLVKKISLKNKMEQFYTKLLRYEFSNSCKLQHTINFHIQSSYTAKFYFWIMNINTFTNVILVC